jgi:hypothetical protein
MHLSSKISKYLGYRFADKLISTVQDKYHIVSTLEHSGKSLTSRLTLPDSDVAPISKKGKKNEVFV